jgi:hypothetical protein
MVAQFMVEHFSEEQISEWTNPAKKARRNFDLVYKDLYPSLLSSPCGMVESRHVFPRYASAALRQCTCSDPPRLTRQVAENHRIETYKGFFRYRGQQPLGDYGIVERRAVIHV